VVLAFNTATCLEQCSSGTTLMKDFISRSTVERIDLNISLKKRIQFFPGTNGKKQAQNSWKEQIFVSNHIGSYAKS
jgi:hypothetical protein